MSLTACGFKPLYGLRSDGTAAGQDLAKIAVGPIPDRLGQQVRNNLLDRLNPQGSPEAPSYRLDVTISEKEVGLAVQSDDTVSRINLTVSAAFVLREGASRDGLFTGKTRTIAAYNVTSFDYANVIAERDARSRAARAIADDLAARLGVYFRTRNGSGS